MKITKITKFIIVSFFALFACGKNFERLANNSFDIKVNYMLNICNMTDLTAEKMDTCMFSCKEGLYNVSLIRNKKNNTYSSYDFNTLSKNRYFNKTDIPKFNSSINHSVLYLDKNGNYCTVGLLPPPSATDKLKLKPRSKFETVLDFLFMEFFVPVLVFLFLKFFVGCPLWAAVLYTLPFSALFTWATYESSIFRYWKWKDRPWF